MEPIGTKSKEGSIKEPRNVQSISTPFTDAISSTLNNNLAQQYSSDESGMPTDMYCPACGEEISGSYLTTFKCPHCDIHIWRDDKGNITNYEQKHTCPECGHTFSDMTDEAPTEFRRVIRNFEQKAEGVFLGLDRIVNRIFS